MTDVRLLLLSVPAVLLSGCATALPRVSEPPPANMDVVFIGQPRTGPARVLQDVVSVCSTWEAEADAQTESARRSQGGWAGVSAGFGAVGTLAGIVAAIGGGVTAGQNNYVAATRFGQVGGAIALTSGVVAGVADLVSGHHSDALPGSLGVALNIDRAVRDHVMRVAAAPPGPERDERAAMEAPLMLLDCADQARQLPGTSGLHSSTRTGPELERALVLLRAANARPNTNDLARALGLDSRSP